MAARIGRGDDPQGVGHLLRRLGLSPQRPLYRAYQQNPEAVRQWKEERYPAIREQARQEGAEIYFGDESGVRTDHHAGTTWAPVGQTPVVEVTGERKSVNMISAAPREGHFTSTCSSVPATPRCSSSSSRSSCTTPRARCS